MPATVVVNRPPAPPPPPKNINYATWDDAERVANDLSTSGAVPSGTITVSEGTDQDVGGGGSDVIPNTYPLLIAFTINMAWTDPDTGRTLNKDVSFNEVAGELVDRLDSYPNASWVPGIEGQAQILLPGTWNDAGNVVIRLLVLAGSLMLPALSQLSYCLKPSTRPVRVTRKDHSLPQSRLAFSFHPRQRCTAIRLTHLASTAASPPQAHKPAS